MTKKDQESEVIGPLSKDNEVEDGYERLTFIMLKDIPEDGRTFARYDYDDIDLSIEVIDRKVTVLADGQRHEITENGLHSLNNGYWVNIDMQRFR